MIYKLYNRLGSGGFAAEAALTLVDEPFELISLDSTPGTELPESFREINPWRQVPVLITKDGVLMTESAAMLIYLATRDETGTLGPSTDTPEYAELVRWLVFLSANVYEAIQRKGYPHRFTSEPGATASVAESARGLASRGFSVAEARLQDAKYMVGTKLTVVDIYLAMLYAWHHDADECPLSRDLTHRVAAEEQIAPLWQRNFDHRLSIKWGRD
ncbi:MAG: glutathione S-transferase family protein [Pseudomonadota bacterium]